MKVVTIEEKDGFLWVKAPYSKDFNTMLAARKEIEIEDFDDETRSWVISIEPDDYEILDLIVYETIGCNIQWL